MPGCPPDGKLMGQYVFVKNHLSGWLFYSALVYCAADGTGRVLKTPLPRGGSVTE
jgi:hypothetical protein